MTVRPGTGPLAGLRVVDLSTTPAGAICTMLLADQGAAVVLVEPAAGALLRAAPVAKVWLRGKRSVTVESLARDPISLRRLFDEADVVVYGSPDGSPPLPPLPAMDSHPGLITCDTGGPAGNLPGDEDLVSAATGIMGRQPGFRPGPVYIVPPLATYATAVMAAEAIGAALFARERTGAGERIWMPLLFGSLQQQTAQLVEVEHPSPLPVLRRNAYGQLPLYRLYQCQDGRWLHLGLINARFWPKLCLAIDRPELLSDPRFEGAVRFTSHESRRSMMDILAETIARRPFAEWDQIFNENDVPCAPACTPEEFARDPQMLIRQGVVTVDDPECGPTQQPGLALHFAGGPLEPMRGAPRIGEHNGDPWGVVNLTPNSFPKKGRGDLGMQGSNDDGARRSVKATRGVNPARGPLVGVRIIDLSGYIAGAMGPAMLADLGADVIKVEGPEGDGLRGAHAGFLAWNRGKRGLCVDLKTEAGRQVVHDLTRTADVVIDNMRPGVADRLGVGYQTLSGINRRLIYCYVSAYGSTGPYRLRPGVDPLMQARSGIERVQGGYEHPPAFLLIAATDNTCAMLNAAGISLALYKRERTGSGLYFETSLLQAATLLQSDHLLSYPDRPPARVNDYDWTGPSPLRRLYQCADGWIFLAADPAPGTAATEGRWPALCAAIGLSDLPDDPRFADKAKRRSHPQDLADVLIAAFAPISVAAALERLSDAGVPACEAVDGFANRFRAELSRIDPSLVATTHHPILGAVTQPGVLAGLTHNPGAVQRAAPLLGEHTESILIELGYDAERIATLRGTGAVAWGLHR